MSIAWLNSNTGPADSAGEVIGALTLQTMITKLCGRRERRKIGSQSVS
jgi:hypothetical protein